MDLSEVGKLKRTILSLLLRDDDRLVDPDIVVLGLGNPGKEYAGTRHNAGAEAVRALASLYKARLRRTGRRIRSARVSIAKHPRNESEVVRKATEDAVDRQNTPEVEPANDRDYRLWEFSEEVSPGGTELCDVLLAVPTTFMNESGIAARWLLEKAGVNPDRLVVVHDDVDLPLGTIRIKFGGGSGGHRGVESITKSLGTNAFQRVRIGIGRPPEDMETADYVLAPFDESERAAAEKAIAKAAEVIRVLAVEGLTRAMNIYNSQRSQ